MKTADKENVGNTSMLKVFGYFGKLFAKWSDWDFPVKKFFVRLQYLSKAELIGFINGTYTLQPVKALKRMLKKLKFVGRVTIDPVENIRKDKFFVMGENGIIKIWMSDDFKNTFLPLVDDVISYTGGVDEKFKLSADMYDLAITAELGHPVPENATVVAGKFISLTSKQPRGQTGDLETSGYSNILYVEHPDGRALVVNARWDSDGQEWNFSCYEFDDGGAWDAGPVAFSPATETQTLES